MDRERVANKIIKLAKLLVSERYAVIRSTFMPLDVLEGTKLFLYEVDSEMPLFQLGTRFEVFGYTTDIRKAIDAFEDVSMVEDVTDIRRIVKRYGLTLRKPSQKRPRY